MQRTKKNSKGQTNVELPLVNAYAAGIDVGDKEHVVAVPDFYPERIQKFGTNTCDLRSICNWLSQLKITTVAMESTGVYWKPLFTMLNKEGFEVYLVNARHVKNVTGRKNDEADAAWIQKLHSCGLLKSAYLPGDEQEALRTLVRYRRSLVNDSSRFMNRMQKSLELMNIKFHTLIRDITGKTGTAFIEAILSGERNPAAFMPLIDGRVRADRTRIIESLEGNWRSEHLFTLQKSYTLYQQYQNHLMECDIEIERLLQQYEALQNEGEISTHSKNVTEHTIKKKKNKTNPRFDVRGYLEKIYGTDVLSIYGLSENSGLEILSETGTDLSKWPSNKHFVSWLNLSPNNKISGGKLISSKLLKKKPNAASQAFRIAANTLQKSNHWLGAYFRRMKFKGGNKYAVVATANKLATIFYKMVTTKEAFIPIDMNAYQTKCQQNKIAFYERKLKELKAKAA